MENPQAKPNPKFSDYIYILYKWKKFLIINLLIVTLAASVYAFLLPLQFKAMATVMMPPESSLGLGGLASLVGGSGKSSAANLGSKLLGISSTSEDVLLGILNSRTMLTMVIKEFNLMEYYEIDDNNIDKALKAFKEDISFDPNEYSMIEVSVINKNPKVSAAIANFFVSKLDSINIELNIENARSNRLFIEKRYQQNVNDLRNAEDSFYVFQKKYGIVAVPEQLEVAFKAAAELEAELTKREIALYFIKDMYGVQSPQYQGALAEVELLKRKVTELNKADKLSGVSNVLFPFKDMPDMSIEYLRRFRDVEIQQTILEIVLPLYEQAKVEEQKSIPTVMLLDKAVPPQLKDSPKRAFIIILFFSLSFALFILVIFMAENFLTHEPRNPLMEENRRFFNMIKRFYRINE